MDRILVGLSETYCVVGVRADGSRHVLSLKLSLEDANYLQRVLLKADIFAAVLVQGGEPAQQAMVEAPPGAGDVDGCA